MRTSLLLAFVLAGCPAAVPSVDAPEPAIDAPEPAIDAGRDASDAPDGRDAPEARDGGAEDGGLRCRDDADCDDGRSSTTEQCLTVGAPDGLGWCLIYECLSDGDCDDGSAVTYDRCLVDELAGTTSCAHERYPNRCAADRDCLTGDGLHAPPPPCVTARCDARGLCAYEWPVGCGLEPASDPIPSCAGAVEGEVCCDGPTCTSPCTLSGAGTPCVTRLVCAGVSPSRWARVVPAGPECPSASCPPAPPAFGSACAGTTICDYGRHDRMPSELAPSTHLGDGPQCTCIDGAWSCVGDPCPAAPPVDGAPADLPAWHERGAVCDYLGRWCLGSPTVPWHCITPLLCPRAAPTARESCLPGADEHCSYARDEPSDPVTTYTGTCDCGADGAWTCGASASSACPAAAPSDAASCAPETGNASCTYFDGSVERRCQCAATGPGLPGRWTCT